MSDAPEYLPVAGDGGREKAFVLSKPKSAAQLAREKNAKEMPQVRREVNQMRMAVGAKWLFHVISDDSFLETLGGDGYGTVCTTIKDLSASYKHDPESLSRWLDVLRRADLIWTETDRGFLIIHIAAFVPPPALRASLVARAKARASNRVASADTDAFFRKTEESAHFTGDGRTENRQNAQPVGHPPARQAGKSHTASGWKPL